MQQCTFGVASGEFLRHIVNQRFIEANPTKVQALRDMTEFKKPKDVQKLTGRIAALCRFVSRLSYRCRPFFQAIKDGSDMVWGEEQQEVFDRIREYLSSPPILTTPKEEEELLCYLAVSDIAVSATLIVEREGVQQPLHSVSKTLTSAETSYSMIEKLALALVTSKRKLR